MLSRYLRPDLLIVDNMMLKQLPRKSGVCLFKVIMHHYGVRSTMMASKRPLEERGKLIGDVPSAAAIPDCFLHHAEIIPIRGRIYRLARRWADAGSEERIVRAKAVKRAIIETRTGWF